MIDIEGVQGHGDTSTSNLVDDPKHDARIEVGLGQGLILNLCKNMHVECVCEGDGATNQAEEVEGFASTKHDWDEVIH